MQIVKQTPSELFLRNQPSHLSKGLISLWALLFSGIPLGLMGVWIYGLGVTQLQCQRMESQVRCEHTQSRLLGLVPGAKTSFDQVTAAAVETEMDVDSDESHSVNHWVVLQTHNGDVTYVEDSLRINGYKGSVPEMQSIANQINEFLVSEQPTWTLQRDLRLRWGHSIFPLSFLGLFVLIGGTVIYVSFRSEILIFDKTSRQFHCIRQTLLGENNWQCPIQDIRGVTVDVQTDGEGKSTYSLKLLPQKSQPDFIPAPKRQVEDACNTILEFLQLSHSTSSTSSTCLHSYVNLTDSPSSQVTHGS